MIDRYFAGKVGIQQRVLPAYRKSFFDLLANKCEGGLSVFAGDPLPGENINTINELRVANFYPASNRHFSNPDSIFYQCRQAEIIDWLEDWNPDVLIVEANPRYPSTPTAIQWMHQHGRPAIGWGLGSPQTSGLLGYWRKRKRLNLFLSFEAMIAYSNLGAREFEALGVPSDRIYVAHNAVSSRPTRPINIRPATYSDRPKVLFVGRLQSRKRIDNLLIACSRLPAIIQPIVWIIGDGPARESFQSLARELYPDAVFLGARQGDELEKYFLNADLFVLPGTGGLAVQQAMTYGLPVIVAQGDGTQEDLVANENGWLIPADDINSLANTLQDALSDPHSLRLMGEKSYDLVYNKINLEQMVDVFIDVISHVNHKRIDQSS